LFERIRKALSTGLEFRKDPEHIIHSIHFSDALAELFVRGDSTTLRRMEESEVGRELLRTRQPLIETVSDRRRLRVLPEGSLARCYFEFIEERGLDPRELAEITHQARVASGGFVPGASCEEVEYLHERFRDMHDVCHVVTGYDSDMGSEFGLIALQSQQNNYHSMSIAVLISCAVQAFKGRADLFRVFYDGWKRGRETAYLLAVDWDALFPLPLTEVRERLGVRSLPEHRPFSC